MQLSATSTHARRNRRTVLGALGILVACADACSVSNGPVVSSGGAVGGASGVAPPSGPAPRPLQEYCTSDFGPKDGEPCPFDAIITCVIGSNPDPACNSIARCDGKRWVFTEPSCTSSCPTAYDERGPGDACGDPLCMYLEATCGCVGTVRAVDGGPPLGDDAGADAGIDAGAEAGSPRLGAWQCVRPANGCPPRRPQAGMRCTNAITCDYGACLFGATGLVLDCVDHVWTEAETTCP